MARTHVYRINPYDGTKTLAGWFDPDKAEAFEERVEFDGRNFVSTAPGVGQFEHEILYRTAGGRWVICRWSQRAGVEPVHRFIGDREAREWLTIAGHDDAVRRFFGPVPEESGPGRPEVGPAIHTRLPADLLDQVDERAKAEGVTRAEMIRSLLAQALAN